MVDGNNVENSHWNLTHTLAWMHARGNGSITREEALSKVLAEVQRRFVPSDLAAVITSPDEDEQDALGRVAFSSELTERMKQQIGALNWFDSLEKELINALRRGEIKCFGINNNSDDSEEITAMEWVHLKFYYGIPTFQAGPEYYRPGTTTWKDLKFQAKSIQKVWPTPNSVNSRKDQEEQTDFPLDTKWEDMTWTFLSNELVRVEAKGISKKYNYTDLGFTDRRKGDTPDTRWAILLRFAEHEGKMGWDESPTRKQRATMSAAVRDIRKRLKVFFNFGDDPFSPYRKTRSYKTKFTIKDKRDIDNKDNSEPEDFSLEEVKEFLNNSQ